MLTILSKPPSSSSSSSSLSFLSSLDAQQAVTSSSFTVSETLCNMSYWIYFSSLLQEYKCYASQQNHSIRLPHIVKSWWKHSSALFSLYSESSLSQSSMTDSNNGNSSTLRCLSRLLMSDKTTTLKNIWGFLFNKNDLLTVKLGQLLQGLTMHIVHVISWGLHWWVMTWQYTADWGLWTFYSIVVTLTKMMRYYKIVKLKTEFYPWSSVFLHVRQSTMPLT